MWNEKRNPWLRILVFGKHRNGCFWFISMWNVNHFLLNSFLLILEFKIERIVTENQYILQLNLRTMYFISYFII